MQKNFDILTRRAFLDRSFKVGLGVALSTLVDIPLIVKRALAEGNIGLNGKKLLFIFLRGANDGLNSVIPVGDPAYAPSRPIIGIPADSAYNYANTTGGCFDATQFLDVSGTVRDANTATFSYANAIGLGNGFAGLHPSLKFLAPVYNAGDLALVHRVAYPNQSRSHFDSQNYWENAAPNNNLVTDGIFYRTMIQSGLANINALTGVSVQSGLPFSLRGSAAAMTNLVDPTRYSLLGIPNTGAGDLKAKNAVINSDQFPFPTKLDRDLLNLQYKNLTDTLSIFANINFTETGNTFLDNVNTDNDAPYYLFPTTNSKNGGSNLAGRSGVTTKYAVDPGAYSLFLNLKAAALILNNTGAIVAGTEYGSFDTHQTQGGANGNHAKLLRSVGWAMYALRKFFMIYGKGGTNPTPGAQVGWNDVVVVTLSEFGRTTVQNGSAGTDHAEGGVMFIAGGGIKGYGKGNTFGVFGCSPSDSYNGVTGLGWLPASSPTAQNGSMFGASSRYLKRAIDYRSVLGKLIRDHLGATQNQLNQIIAGYANPSEHLLSGGTSIDGTPIFGEVPIV